jgi:hypothetical protein
MNEPRRRDGERMRARDRRRVRWPVLLVLAVLAALLTLTSTLERAAPRAPSSAPGVTDLPAPLLDEPVRCTRTDERARIDELRRELRPDGRLTSEIATACPRLLDRRAVVYIGEVVGDVLRRDGGAWVQVNDDAYALEVGPFGAHRERLGSSAGLAVWLPDGLHEQLGAPGRHGRRGDIVRIEGVLWRADPGDGGGMSVRADTLTVLERSVATAEPVDRVLVGAALSAALLALAAWAWARRRAQVRQR